MKITSTITNWFNKIFKPTEITDQPLPGVTGGGSQTSGAGVNDTYQSPVIPNFDFPKPVIANIVRSESLDTQSRRILGSYKFGQLGAIQIGLVKISPSGILGTNGAGITTFALDALTGSATFMGTLKVGLTVETNALIVGTNVSIGNAQDAAGVTTIIGGTVTTSFVNALNVTAQTVNAGWVYAGGIVASQITSGSITVGGTGQPSAIIIRRNGDNGYLTWEDGNKIWSDGSQYMGFKANGERFYFYTGSTLYALFQRGSQAGFYAGISCDGNFNVTGGNEARLTGNTVFEREIQTYYNYIRVDVDDHNHYIYFNDNTTFNSNGINFGNGRSLTVNADKNAIVETSDGYKTLSCIESPEVWFMDFCNNKESIDPVFLEVTEGEKKFIKCDDGIYQVWARRKNFTHQRFERKTKDQFIRNNLFWNQAK